MSISIIRKVLPHPCRCRSNLAVVVEIANASNQFESSATAVDQAGLIAFNADFGGGVEGAMVKLPDRSLGAAMPALVLPHLHPLHANLRITWANHPQPHLIAV